MPGQFKYQSDGALKILIILLPATPALLHTLKVCKSFGSFTININIINVVFEFKMVSDFNTK